MSRNKNRSQKSLQQAFEVKSREAENNLAESTNENRNQKGHVPNSPSTG